MQDEEPEHDEGIKSGAVAFYDFDVKKTPGLAYSSQVDG